jgi:hypothetical protein
MSCATKQYLVSITDVGTQKSLSIGEHDGGAALGVGGQIGMTAPFSNIDQEPQHACVRSRCQIPKKLTGKKTNGGSVRENRTLDVINRKEPCLACNR